MNNPAHNFCLVRMQYQKMQELLLSENDNKAEVLALLDEGMKNIDNYQKEYWNFERMQEHEQTGYFENIKIKYLIKHFGDDEPHFTFEREFEDYQIDMKTLRCMIRNERDLHNKNESYLSAEIVLIDLDCEDE